MKRTIQLAALSILLWPAQPAWSADDPSPESRTSAVSTSGDSALRFDGYRYLDVDGSPLPFQSDAEIEAFLADAEIIDSSLVGEGITIPRKLVLQGDGFRAHAIFKDVDVERHKVKERVNDSHRFDTAAYKLDRLLGMDRVPPSTYRTVGGETGTIRIWLEQTVNEHKRSRKLEVEPPDYRRWHQQYLLMRLFDNLVANRDSNLGNLLIDPNWRMWFIDCTRCFGKTTALYYPIKKFEHCERGFWEGIQNLDKETAERESTSTS
jgi:hypothetical protein